MVFKDRPAGQHINMQGCWMVVQHMGMSKQKVIPTFPIQNPMNIQMQREALWIYLGASECIG